MRWPQRRVRQLAFSRLDFALLSLTATGRLHTLPPFVPPRSRLSESPALTVSVSIVPCSILGKSAFILRTDANEQARGHHPRTIVEIAADVRLRDTLHLKDGDIVEIVVPLSAVESRT